MKIATFNIENIFHRDDHLIKKTISQSIISWMGELEDLLRKNIRAEHDYARMRELSFLLGFHKASVEPYVVMRRKAGQLFIQKRDKCFDYKATERTNWSGWIKLRSRPIPEVAVENKARVITEVNPDILVLQEVEDRQSLIEFNEHYLPEEVRYEEVVVVPGNDDCGLDLGIMLKGGYRVKSIVSHSNENWEGERLFDKDFQEYEIIDLQGRLLTILSAHLCEPGDDQEFADERRKKQSGRIAEVYKELRGNGRNAIILGTYNVPSYCDSISPLLQEKDLEQVKKHKSFRIDIDTGLDASYHSLGAYRVGVNLKQKDYLLLSPDLFRRVKNSGLNRKGVWPEKKDQYITYSTLTCEGEQASSHPLIWSNLDF